MSAAWRALGEEIARWNDAGRVPEFWLRDDDAVDSDAAIERLLRLCAPGIPIALAVIPRDASESFLARLPPVVHVLQHGYDHRNRAASGEKKTEFAAGEPGEEALARLAAGRARLRELSGGRFLPVLVPPWNRLPASLAGSLPAAGLRGLSRYGARAGAEAAPGVRQVNTHVDLIDWRGGRGFAGAEAVLGLATRHLRARRLGTADPAEPTGWLTHHACHDEPAWTFLARLFDFTRTAGVRWRSALELFEGAL